MSTPVGVTQVPKSLTELLGFKDFLPEFAYQMDGVPDSEQVQEHKSNYESFLKENYELILNQMMNCNIPVGDKDIYLRGFKDAVAITELWLSSLVVNEDISK